MAAFTSDLSLFSQDNFQKLMQVQLACTGHQEIVQPGRVSSSDPTLQR